MRSPNHEKHVICDLSFGYFEIGRRSVLSYQLYAMAGGAPVPVPTSDPDQRILSIADLEKAASQKLGKSARGNLKYFLVLEFPAVFMLTMRRHIFPSD